jgi:hypothetical protein
VGCIGGRKVKRKRVKQGQSSLELLSNEQKAQTKQEKVLTGLKKLIIEANGGDQSKSGGKPLQAVGRDDRKVKSLWSGLVGANHG